MLEGLIWFITSAIALRRVLQCKARGYALATTIYGNIGATAFMGIQINGLIYASGFGEYLTYNYLQNVLFLLAGTITILAALNLSLMWIEFAMASKRLESIGTNLRHTRTLLIVYMFLYVLTAIGCIIADLIRGDEIAFRISIGLIALTVLLVSPTYIIGARGLTAMYVRQADQSKRNAAHQVEIVRMTRHFEDNGEVVRIECSAQQEKDRAQRMMSLASLTVRAARRMAISLLAMVTFLVAWLAVTSFTRSVPTYWLLVLFGMSFLCFAACSIAFYMAAMHRPGLAKHNGYSSRSSIMQLQEGGAPAATSSRTTEASTQLDTTEVIAHDRA